jgi:hypothetical protein
MGEQYQAQQRSLKDIAAETGIPVETASGKAPSMNKSPESNAPAAGCSSTAAPAPQAPQS